MPNVGTPNIPSAGDLIALAKGLVDARVESLWVGDHLLFNVPVLEPIAVLGLLAGTVDCTLGTNVALVGFRSGAWLAKSIRTIEWLARGAVEVGVGLGGDYAPEFDLLGISVKERVSRFHAQLDLFQRATGLVDPGIGRRAPRLWIGGRSPETLARVRAMKAGWSALHIGLSRLDRVLSGLGRSVPWMMVAKCVVLGSESQEEALRRAAAQVQAQYALPLEALRRYLFIGDPDAIVEQLAPYVSRRPTRLIVQLVGSLDELADSRRIVQRLAASIST